MKYLKIWLLYVVCFLHVSGFADDRLRKITKIDNSPIVYDEEDDEYRIVWESEKPGVRERHSVVLKYDPFTGKALDSGRGSSFVKPDEDEISKLGSKLSEFDTIDDVIAFYGEPDRIVEKFEGGTQYDFESSFDTIKLIVTVDEAGHTSATFYPKQKKKEQQKEN